jgi:hypothetical protein
MNKFYVGAIVEAIMDHSKGNYKKGDRFEVQGIKKGCSCSPILLNLKITGSNSRCYRCNTPFDSEYYGAIAFKLVDDIPAFEEVTFTKIKETIPAQSVN